MLISNMTELSTYSCCILKISKQIFLNVLIQDVGYQTSQIFKSTIITQKIDKPKNWPSFWVMWGGGQISSTVIEFYHYFYLQVNEECG